jgi:hypothetical protein
VETVTPVRITLPPPTPFPKPFSSALEPQAKGIIGSFCGIDLCTFIPAGQAKNILQGLFFSRPQYFQPMIRFWENHKRMALRTRFHAPDFESRSLGRARRENDRSFIDLNLATPANY